MQSPHFRIQSPSFGYEGLCGSRCINTICVLVRNPPCTSSDSATLSWRTSRRGPNQENQQHSKPIQSRKDCYQYGSIYQCSIPPAHFPCVCDALKCIQHGSWHPTFENEEQVRTVQGRKLLWGVSQFPRRNRLFQNILKMFALSLNLMLLLSPVTCGNRDGQWVIS